MSKKQNVVIVGAGFAGIGIAKQLVRKLDLSTYRVIVVTERQQLVILPALVRTTATAEGNLEKLVIPPYGDPLRGLGEFKYGTVTSFTSTEDGGEVVLESGEKVEYSILVLATGYKYEGPLGLPKTPSEIEEHLATWRSKFSNAKSIVIVGGGAVGVEYAGELKHYYPGLDVTIVQGHHLPLTATWGDRFRKMTLDNLRNMGVKFVLNDRLDATSPSEDGTVTTRKGEVIKADLVLLTRGGSPNTSFIGESLGKDVLVSSGHVKILPTLQIPGFPRVFVAGDIMDFDEERLAGKILRHCRTVATNVQAVLQGLPAKAQYNGSFSSIALTMGPNAGLTYLGVFGIILGNWLTSIFKSRSLSIPKFRRRFL